MTEQEERERFRYLQLKAKASGSTQETAPIQSGMDRNIEVAKGIAKATPALYGKFLENAPEVAGATLAGMKASGVGALPAMALTAGGAAAGEGVRQLMSNEQIPPLERAKKLGGAALRGAAGPVVERAVLPALGAVGKFAGNQLEKLSGLGADKRNAGILTRTFKDPGILTARDTPEAGQLYQTAKSQIPEGANVMDDLERNVAIWRRAKNILKQGGKLEPYEAKQARNAVDNTGHGYSEDALVPLRAKLDTIAKSDSNILKADILEKRAKQGEALRNLFPTNAGGNLYSRLPMLLEAAFLGGGYATKIPAVSALAAPFSPLAQGMGAAGLGLATKPLRTAPVGLTDLIAQYFSKKDQQGK